MALSRVMAGCHWTDNDACPRASGKSNESSGASIMRQRCPAESERVSCTAWCARAPGRNEDRSAGVNRRKRRALRTIMEEAMGILNGAIQMPLQGRQFLWRWLAPIVIILRETSARGWCSDM
jgi:hypothetical protein